MAFFFPFESSLTFVEAFLYSTCVLQQGWQLLLSGRQVTTTTNVLLVDEDVGDGGLAG